MEKNQIHFKKVRSIQKLKTISIKTLHTINDTSKNGLYISCSYFSSIFVVYVHFIRSSVVVINQLSQSLILPLKQFTYRALTLYQCACIILIASTTFSSQRSQEGGYGLLPIGRSLYVEQRKKCRVNHFKVYLSCGGYFFFVTYQLVFNFSKVQISRLKDFKKIRFISIYVNQNKFSLAFAKSIHLRNSK